MKREFNMKELFLLRGLPGSGKSTLAKSIAGSKGYIKEADMYFVEPVNNTTLKKGYLKKSQPRQYGGMKIKRKSPKPPTTKMPPQGTIDMGPMNMGTVSTYSNAIMTYLSGPLTAAINKVGSKLPCPTNVTNQNTATQNTATQNTATQNTPIQENTGNNNQSAGYRRTRRLVMKKRKKSLRRSRS